MMNMIKRLEELKNYGYNQEINWGQAHLQHGISGALNIHIPIVAHAVAERRNQIKPDLEKVIRTGQDAQVNIDPTTKQGFIKLTSKLTRSSAQKTIAELKMRGVQNITVLGPPRESQKVSPPQTDRPTKAAEATDMKPHDWNRN